MDWPNERYVRLYTRDTPEWLCMPWQSRALWPLLIRKFDRSGIVETRLGARGISVLVGLPVDVVEVGIAGLLEDGCLMSHDRGYIAPNYIEAQETPQSDGQRKRDSRERRRALSMTDETVVQITECHARSHVVTDGHDRSQVVTPSLAEPSRSNICDPGKPDSVSEQGKSPTSTKRRSKSALDATPAELASVRVILDRLGKVAGVAYQGCDSHTALIVSQLRDGITEQELRAVVAYCAAEWSGNSDMRKYLRPETLFGPRTISKYLDPARSKYARMIAQASTEPDGRPQLVCIRGDGDDPPLGPDLNVRPETA